MKLQFKDYRKHILAVGLFLILVVVYFAPGITEGKVLRQGDMEKYSGMVEEINQYARSGEKGDGEVVAWTGSMFSGMPTYSMAVPGTSKNYLTWVERLSKSIDYQGASIVFTGLICFYILLCVLGVNFWLALAGAIAFAFSSYNIIIIEAGHITKAYVIAYMPLTIAGMWLLFKEKWLMGAALFTIGVALSLMNSHVQITYYLMLFCVVLYMGFCWNSIRNKQHKKLLKLTLVFVACIMLAVLPNVQKLYSDLEMSKESLRGPTELTEVTTGSQEKVSSGLDIDYAFSWSYSKAETFTLLIPDFYGGASGGTLGRNSELYKELQSRGAQVGNEIQSYTYWGDQPFTSGPVYFGALVCFLFVLGMLVIKNPLKWWILGGSIFFIILAWGRNLAFINDFLFHYLPLYNKFRVPSMALVIPGMTFPLIAIWGLKDILSQQVDREKLKKSLYYSLGIIGGLCLLFCILPGMFLDFASPLDVQYNLPDWYYNALLKDRESLLRSDAFRSLVFIVLGGALLNWFRIGKDKVKIGRYVAMGIAVLILVDLWSVDKRYLNAGNYVAPQSSAHSYVMTTADKEILKDKDLSYRVLNLNNPFNETSTSYYHKSIGGYSPAKLRRYQELIDHRISGEINMVVNGFKQAQSLEGLMNIFQHTPTLDMLNMRYVIYNPEQPPVYNPYAYGNAWFVDSVEIVANADEEIAALDGIDPRRVAVVDRRFASAVDNFVSQPDSSARIEMTGYKPTAVTYKSNAVAEQLAVFSEIYYPHGWEAYIDGQPQAHFRVDWILRGMRIPAGEHVIEFKFVPKGYITAMTISSVSSLLVLLLLLGAIGWSLWGYFRKDNVA